MNWQKVLKRSKTGAMQNVVSIYKDGTLNISSNLYQKMNNPNKVELFVDKDEKVIGIKPTDDQDPDAYNIQTPKDSRRVVLRSKNVFKVMGFEEVPSGRKEANWSDNEGMLIVKLDK